MDLVPGNPGKVKKIIDYLIHLFSAVNYPVKMFFPFVIEFVRIPFEQKVGEAHYRPQRRPKIVGYGVDESFHFLISARKLIHISFQFLVQLFNIFLCPLALGDVRDRRRSQPADSPRP
jgi:hypothetical protein